MNEKLRRAGLQKWLEDAAPNLWQVAAAGGGILLSTSGVLGGLYPFGLAFLLGIGTEYIFAAAAGVAVGYLAFLPITQSLQYLAAVAAALAGRCLFKNKFVPGAASAASTMLLVQSMLAISGLATAAETFGALGNALLSVGAGFLLLRSANPRKNGMAAYAGQALWFGLALLPSLARVNLGPLQLGVAVAGAATLVLGYRGRLRDCGSIGVAAAMLIAAAQPELALSALGMAAAGLVVGWLAPGERLGAPVLFVATAALAALASGEVSFAWQLMASAAGSVAVFFLIPADVLRRLAGQAEVQTAVAKPRVADTAVQLEAVASALTGIADTVNQVYETLPQKGESYNWVVDYVAEELCRSCGRRESCWVEGYSATIDGFYQLKPVLEREGRAAVEQLPGQFCRCVHPVELCSATCRAYTLYRSRRENRVKATAMRSALTEQYTAMAEALGQMAEQLGQTMAPDEGKTARLAQMMQTIGLEPLEAQAGYDSMGRLKVTLAVNRTAFKQSELDELRTETARICRRALGEFTVNHSGPITTLFIAEQPLYCPEFGVASRSAKPEACGDAVNQFCDAYGNAHLLLCDGMGVGRPAAVDGALAANLATRLLKAGFSAESAARLVNVALSLKSDEESAATLDLVSVDLYTGRSVLFKAGACPTFLVREGKAEAVESTSLPVGILNEVSGQKKVLNLHENQLVVMVSDGVLIDGTTWLLQQLELCAAVGSTPQEIATVLADTAHARSEKNPYPDDITVAVMLLNRSI